MFKPTRCPAWGRKSWRAAAERGLTLAGWCRIRLAPVLAWAMVTVVAAGAAPGPQAASEAVTAGPIYGSTPADPRGRAYRLAVHPLHNPVKLQKAYQPLIDRLQSELPGLRFQLEASRDYAAYERKLQQREPDLLLPNPWQTLKAMEAGYTVIAMAGDPDDFRGLILVRRDGAIQRPIDLAGQTVSFPSPTALAACIMPQYYLHEHGLVVGRDFKSLYVGSQESSIMSVFQRRSAAAATWPPPWRAFQLDHPIEAAELKVMWQTAPLLNNSVMVRSDVPTSVRDGVRRVLLGLNDSAAGRSLLAAMRTSRFFESDDQRYAVVRHYIDRFERDVRPVEAKP